MQVIRQEWIVKMNKIMMKMWHIQETVQTFKRFFWMGEKRIVIAQEQIVGEGLDSAHKTL
tara:strand:+ start:3926 stop:4105 length:180 start_codon:yes stop_codon:yes gene_type:complete